MLWGEQQNATFPYAARDLNVEGTTLLQLDVILGRILTECLKTDGVARPIRDTRELERCTRILNLALDKLQLPPEVRSYFSRLRLIVALLSG